jgi:acetyl-CoA synthetase
MVIKKPWPSMMTGIYKHKKMYKSYFLGKWFRTHDLAKKDSQGNFFFKGREDDIIKTSGERVSPLELENILIKHNAVKEVAVIGIPDKIKGSIIKAFVVLNKGFKGEKKLKEELAMFVKKDYAGHSYPKKVEFIKSLPKTNSGKIIRMKLRKK